MKIDVISVGVYSENCYILSTENKNAIIIDPGAQPEDIAKFCKKQGFEIKSILLTHGHFDHIGAVSAIKAECGCDVIIHKEDNELLLNPDLVHDGISVQMKEEYGYEKASADKLVSDGDVIKFNELTITVIHTKGHTRGSCCFLLANNKDNNKDNNREEEKFLFSGDTLFKGSVGRTDLYGGNSDDLIRSVKKLADSNFEATVLPGHGTKTSLKLERITNPFMGQNYDDIF